MHAAANIDESQARIIQVTTGTDQPLDQHLTLGLNKAAIVELDTDAQDVLVSSPDIVDAVVNTPRRIFLLATKTGQTNAFFFDARRPSDSVARHPGREGRHRSGQP